MADGVNYPAVSQLVKRFDKRLSVDDQLSETLFVIERVLKIQT